jgi:pyrrolidone-carboxylate peptidase
VGFLLATAAYIALAWYDVLYDCNDHLGPTLFGWLSAPFKPAEYSRKFEELPIKYQKIVRGVDIAVLALVAAAFIYPFVFSKK